MKVFQSHSLLRYLGIALLCSAFAFLGVYVGYLVFVSPGPRDAVAIAAQSEPASYLHFEAGDGLPDELVLTSDSIKVGLRTIVADSDCVLLFLTFHCDPCIDLLRAWRTALATRVRPNVRTIVCLREDEWAIPLEYQGLLRGLTVVYYDGTLWEQRYNMVFWPCLIGVDNSGFVHHVQFGWENTIDYELANYFFSPRQ